MTDGDAPAVVRAHQSLVFEVRAGESGYGATRVFRAFDGKLCV